MRQLGVDVTQYARRREVVGGAGFDQSFGDRHEQRRRHSFPRDIADAEAEVVLVDQEQVVEVAPHFSSRDECGEDIEVRSMGERGEGEGKHAHLDLSPDVQLALHPLLDGPSLLQVVERLLQFGILVPNLIQQFVSPLLLDDLFQMFEEFPIRTDTSPDRGRNAPVELSVATRERLHRIEEPRESSEVRRSGGVEKLKDDPGRRTSLVDSQLEARLLPLFRVQPDNLRRSRRHSGHFDGIPRQQRQDTTNLPSRLDDGVFASDRNGSERLQRPYLNTAQLASSWLLPNRVTMVRAMVAASSLRSRGYSPRSNRSFTPSE